MKFGYKYLLPSVIYLLIMLLGGFIQPLISYIVIPFYSFLHLSFPHTFPKPSSVLDPAGYENLQMLLWCVSAFIAILIITYISMRLDNKRFELIITRTDGLYRVHKMSLSVLKEFFVADLIPSVIVPIVYILPIYLIPEEYLWYLPNILWVGGGLSAWVMLPEALLFGILASVFCRFILIPRVLDVWRANWLTASVE